MKMRFFSVICLFFMVWIPFTSCSTLHSEDTVSKNEYPISISKNVTEIKVSTLPDSENKKCHDTSASDAQRAVDNINGLSLRSE